MCENDDVMGDEKRGDLEMRCRGVEGKGLDAK